MACATTKKENCTATTVSTKENMVETTFGKRFAILLHFWSLVFLGLNLILLKRLILWSGDPGATYKFSNLSLEYDAIFEESDATTIIELHTPPALIL